MASPRALIAGNGDLENGWKRLSSVRMGSGFAFWPAAGFLNQEKRVRELAGRHERRQARRESSTVER